MEIFIALANSSLRQKVLRKRYLKNTSILEVWGQLSHKSFNFEKWRSYDHFLMKLIWLLLFFIKIKT